MPRARTRRSSTPISSTRASDLGLLLEPLLAGKANVVFGTRAWTSHSVVQLLVRDGQQGGHARDERALQLLDLGRHDLPQGDADRALQAPAPAGARLRDRAGDHCARAARASGSSRCRSATARALARRARSSRRPTGCASSARWCAAGSSEGAEADGETRTPDPIITSDVLYQLSYVGLGGECSPQAAASWVRSRPAASERRARKRSVSTAACVMPSCSEISR